MKIAGCQLPDVRDDCGQSLSLVKQYASAAAVVGCRIVCFPECFLQGYSTDEGTVRRVALGLDTPEFELVLEQLSSCTPVLVLGVVERSGDSYFNTAVAISAGIVVCRYRKANLLKCERGVFHAGTGPGVFTVDGTGVGIAICNDLNFRDTVASARRAGAEIIACPSNNMMERRAACRWKDRHTAIRQRRAKETDVWLLSSDVTGTCGSEVSYGPTSVIDPGGVVVAQVPPMQTGIAVYEIPKATGPVAAEPGAAVDVQTASRFGRN